MKKIILFIVGLVAMLSLNSCVTTAYAQVDDEIDTSVVISYGTPYYNTSGLLMYYVYRDMFYYPYYYNSGWYFRHYAKPLPPRHYRPVPRDFYRHRPTVSHRFHTAPHHSIQRGGYTGRPQHHSAHGGHFHRGR